jgi:hypothetical protein
MTSDLKILARALMWIMEKLGHDDECTHFACRCDLNDIVSDLVHGKGE